MYSIAPQDDGSIEKIRALEAELQMRDLATEKEREKASLKDKAFEAKLTKQKEQEKQLHDKIVEVTHLMKSLQQENRVSEVEAEKFITKIKEEYQYNVSTHVEDKQKLAAAKERFARDQEALKQQNEQLHVPFGLAHIIQMIGRVHQTY